MIILEGLWMLMVSTKKKKSDWNKKGKLHFRFTRVWPANALEQEIVQMILDLMGRAPTARVLPTPTSVTKFSAIPWRRSEA